MFLIFPFLSSETAANLMVDGQPAIVRQWIYLCMVQRVEDRHMNSFLNIVESLLLIYSTVVHCIEVSVICAAMAVLVDGDCGSSECFGNSDDHYIRVCAGFSEFDGPVIDGGGRLTVEVVVDGRRFDRLLPVDTVESVLGR